MDDLDFVQRCIKGDKLIWSEFVNKYSRLIYSSIHAVLGTKSRHKYSVDTPNDIFQEICFSLVRDNYKRLRSFEGRNKCSLASWLRQVSVNATIDYLRRAKSFISLEEENNDELALKDIIADSKPLVKELLLDREKFSQLKDCIDILSTDDKYLVELHINQDLTLEQLRKHLKVSRGAVDMRKARIVERLRDCFRHKGFVLD